MIIPNCGPEHGSARQLTPFLKWPGGKRWLAKQVIATLQGQHINTYYEPFLGGGALFFSLQPAKSILTDINTDLINTYYYVKHCPSQLVTRLKSLPVTKSTYYTLRETMPIDPLDKAVRFLFLNRTAFGGMYRLNKSGGFNVPYGGGQRTPQPLWKNNLISNASHALKNSLLLSCDFEVAMRTAGPGDLIYCDPTYTVAHNNNGFVRYNEINFSWADQKRLAESCNDAVERGATVIVSNAFHEKILDLFCPKQHLILNRPTRLCPQPEHRGKVDEYLFIYESATQSDRHSQRALK